MPYYINSAGDKIEVPDFILIESVPKDWVARPGSILKINAISVDAELTSYTFQLIAEVISGECLKFGFNRFGLTLKNMEVLKYKDVSKRFLKLKVML
jgi:hypothetical protein